MMTPVIEHLWTGSAAYSDGVAGVLLCVLEHLPFEVPEGAIHFPVMREAKIHHNRLNVAADLIEMWIKRELDVVVLSGDGNGRSALVAAWYLHKKQHFSLDESYRIIQTYNPHVQDLRGRVV